MSRNTLVHLPLSETGRFVNIPTNLPVIFLAGPIRNAPPWRDDAIAALVGYDKPVFVASPGRKVAPVLKEFIEPDSDSYATFPRQRAWEQHYLYQAAKKGVIIFWLPPEAIVKEHPDKIYAHITMMELGQWIARVKADPSIKMVIGTRGDFPEWRTIKFELETEVPDVPVCSSIHETVATALALASVMEE